MYIRWRYERNLIFFMGEWWWCCCWILIYCGFWIWVGCYVDCCLFLMMLRIYCYFLNGWDDCVVLVVSMYCWENMKFLVVVFLVLECIWWVLLMVMLLIWCLCIIFIIWLLDWWCLWICLKMLWWLFGRIW